MAEISQQLRGLFGVQEGYLKLLDRVHGQQLRADRAFVGASRE